MQTRRLQIARDRASLLDGEAARGLIERDHVDCFGELTNRVVSVGPAEVKLVMQARTGATEEVLLRGQVFEERHHIVWAARRIEERFTVSERITAPPPSSVRREFGDRVPREGARRAARWLHLGPQRGARAGGDDAGGAPGCA